MGRSRKELPDKSIAELFSALSCAMMRRCQIDPGFSYIGFLKRPINYHPLTSEELAVWDELTHPRRHEEIVQFPSERLKLWGTPFVTVPEYYRMLYYMALEESTRRLAANPPQTTPDQV